MYLRCAKGGDNMQDIIIRVVYDLPYTVGAFSVMDPNGDANIYTNGNIPQDKQEQAVSHELRHIQLDHLQSGRCVEEMEAEARNDL